VFKFGSEFRVRDSWFVFSSGIRQRAANSAYRHQQYEQLWAENRGTRRAHSKAVGVRRFTDLRAWQACNAYKNAVYRLCEQGALSTDWKRRGQLEDSVSGPPAHIAEGFGRFNPADFARFVVMARSSLMESQNHLRDAVDRRYVSEDVRVKHDKLAEAALEEVTGLLEYLQSPEALRNARRARERRIASRPERRTLNPNKEARTESEHEPRSENGEE
jgi:four helix bundle protein